MLTLKCLTQYLNTCRLVVPNRDTISLLVLFLFTVSATSPQTTRIMTGDNSDSESTSYPHIESTDTTIHSTEDANIPSSSLTTRDPQDARSEFTPSIATDYFQLTITQEENPETESSATTASDTLIFKDKQNTVNVSKGKTFSVIENK